MLEQVSKDNRKDLVKAATELYKSGAEPSETASKEHYSRAERRQGQRAMGWRGTKAKRQNIVKRLPEVRKALLVDEALAAAKNRAQHPIKSRLRRS